MNKKRPNTPKGAYDFIKEVFEETGKEPLIANWSAAYNYAVKEGIINLSEKEKQDIRDHLTAVAKLEASTDYRRAKFELEPIGFQQQCKKYALILHFK